MLEPILNAWDDIVANRLYITGSASAGEHFQDDHVLPNTPGAHICETCVTTTWIQLNLQLLRLTGEAKYGDELERTFYNHLAAAQNPRGDDWCYYTALEGNKPYDPGINCCHSSGPRGMALVPQASYLKGHESNSECLLVSTLETSRATITLDGVDVTVVQESGFPREGKSVLTLRMKKPANFMLKVRIPPWATPFGVKIGTVSVGALRKSPWASIKAKWHDGDKIELNYQLSGRMILGDHGNAGKAALAWGPFVLAYDQKLNPDGPTASAVELTESQPVCTLKPGDPLTFTANIVSRRDSQPKPATFVTFADAGSTGGVYRVWLRAPGSTPSTNDSLLADGEESRSRAGNQHGSINDGDPDSFVVTFNGQPAREDWFAVTLPAPARIGRVAFAHGQTFHDGGWFDASAGKPKVQLQRTPGGAWETVGTLDDYPATTATNHAGLKPGQTFTFRLSEPMQAVAVRVWHACQRR